MCKHLHMSWTDVEDYMTIYERRIHLKILKEDIDKQNEEIEKRNNQVKSGGKKYGR